MSRVIVDTGPLVAYLDRSDRDHAWSKDRMMGFTEPLLTCDAVIAEAAFLLRRGGIPVDGLLALIQRGLVVPGFWVAEEIERITQLMRSYRDTPMSLADACLVRMTGIHDGASVMTLDSDFRIYRKQRRRVIPVVMPER